MENNKKYALQSALFSLTSTQPFYGYLLQEIVIKYSAMVPTAGITYEKKRKQYEVYINPDFFCALSNEERLAVLHHEILHFTNKHLFRLPFLNVSEQERMLYNISGDMAINQFIQHLPKGCVNVKDWKMDDGSPFPLYASMEGYYELIKKEQKQQKETSDGHAKKGGKPGEKGDTQGNVNDLIKHYKPFDVHDWEALDEETKKEMIEEAKKVLKRTMEKTSCGYSVVPDSIKDLLEHLENESSKINHKDILKNTIKKTMSASDKEHTWKRPNKRYGALSAGTKMGNLPVLNFYIDTSGSISITELNMFLSIMNEFLKVGVRKCHLALWHTEMYYKDKYKYNAEMNKEDLQSGGTNVLPALEDVKKCSPDLAIFLTDGYFDVHDIAIKSQIIWIISEGGNKDHPMKHVGKTIYLENLK